MPDIAYALKRCSVCRVEKPLDEFPRDRKRKFGRGIRCRVCDNARSQIYYKLHKRVQTAAEAVGAAWRREENAPAPLFFEDCVECHRPFVKLRGNRRDVYCGEECRRRVKRRRESARQSNRQNKRRTAHSHSDITVEEERRIRRAKRCALCRCYLTDKPGPRQRNLDHIIPINIGGTHTHGNVRMLCWTCNHKRPHDGSDVTQQPTLWAQDVIVFESRQRAKAKRAQARAEAAAAKPRGKTPEQRNAEREQRAAQAVAMRQQGCTWAQIATALGYASTGAAFNAVHGNASAPRGNQKPSAAAHLLPKRAYAQRNL